MFHIITSTLPYLSCFISIALLASVDDNFKISGRARGKVRELSQ